MTKPNCLDSRQTRADVPGGLAGRRYTRAYGELLGAPDDAPHGILLLRDLARGIVQDAVNATATLKHAAAKLGVGYSSLRRWRDAGLLR